VIFLKETENNNSCYTTKQKELFKLFKHSDYALLTYEEFETLSDAKLINNTFGKINYDCYVLEELDLSNFPQKSVCHISELGIQYRQELKSKPDKSKIFNVVIGILSILVPLAIYLHQLSLR